MNDKLSQILSVKEEEIERLRPHKEILRKQALLRNDFQLFGNAIQRLDGLALIAEIKHKSPSAGVIAKDLNPVLQAQTYERGGAHALSVLTDKQFFGGHIAFLRDIRDAVELPLLRKDFIIDEIQVYESAVAGADAILLIVAALSQEKLERLYELAKTLQMDVLVEVHNLEEMDRALDLGAEIIGINNRNLKTFEVDLKTTESLIEEIPNTSVAVSESGIDSGEAARFVFDKGVQAILVGEALMRASNVPKKIQELLLQPSPTPPPPNEKE